MTKGTPSAMQNAKLLSTTCACNRQGVDLRDDQRHAVRHAERRAVVDHLRMHGYKLSLRPTRMMPAAVWSASQCQPNVGTDSLIALQ